MEQKLYEELEGMAVTRRSVSLAYRPESGGRIELQGKILGIYSFEGADYIRMDNGLDIRVDTLVRLDNRDLKNLA